MSEEEVWRALSNPIRRQMLDMLRNGPATTGEMAKRFPKVTRYAVMQHLGVLEEASLVLPRKQGRRSFKYLNPVPIERIYQRWMHPYASRIAKEMLALERHLGKERE